MLTTFKAAFIAGLFIVIVQTARASDATPPLGSWERWLQAIQSNGKGGLPGRPDGKAFDAELPMWVDCHLSWYFDRPELSNSRTKSQENKQISQKLVLRSDPKTCKGQIEQWAK